METSVSSAVPALPEPDGDAKDHSARLVQCICEEIGANNGWISFARYMDLALYAPGLGYYSAGNLKFGRSGDFVTAPEVSPLFSRCIASQCAEIFDWLGSGEILEIGAGSGVMAADILLELERAKRLPHHYLILEVSADLRQRQRETLRRSVPHLMSRVAWLDRLPEKPVTGVVLANEVLDALPVERFRIRASVPEIMGVEWTDGGLRPRFGLAPDSIRALVQQVQADVGAVFPEGYVSELRPALGAWLASVASALGRGVMIFSDYGLPRREYYHPDRSNGTLLCHYRHRVHSDPFVLLGLQDITAWVDFTSVAEIALDHGMSLAGFTPQAQFLIGTDLEGHMSRSRAAPGGESELQEQVELARQVKMLTLPGEMGERFKFIGLRRDFDAPLSGFSHRDLTGTL